MADEDGTISDTLKGEEHGLCRMTKLRGHTYGEDDNTKVIGGPPR